MSATKEISSSVISSTVTTGDAIHKMIVRAIEEETGISEDMVDIAIITNGFYSDWLQDNLAISVLLKPMAPIEIIEELWSLSRPSSTFEVSKYFFERPQAIENLLGEEKLEDLVKYGVLRRQTVFSLKEHIRVRETLYDLRNTN